MATCISGSTSSVARAYSCILGTEPIAVYDRRIHGDYHNDNVSETFPACDRYLFTHGYISGDDASNMDPGMIYDIGIISMIQFVNAAFHRNPFARVVVIGSMSGINGSHDPHYAAAKAGLHAFVRTWQGLPETGMLNCVAPTIIRDSRMAQARHDYPAVIKDRATVTSHQVAALCHQLLYRDHGMNRAVVEMTGERIH